MLVDTGHSGILDGVTLMHSQIQMELMPAWPAARVGAVPICLETFLETAGSMDGMDVLSMPKIHLPTIRVGVWNLETPITMEREKPMNTAAHAEVARPARNVALARQANTAGQSVLSHTHTLHSQHSVQIQLDLHAPN